MTKTDFVAIAEAIRDSRGAMGTRDGSPQARIFDSLSRTIADVCAKQNPRFQRSKFLATCGVEGFTL